LASDFSSFKSISPDAVLAVIFPKAPFPVNSPEEEDNLLSFKTETLLILYDR
jgi:hypothetical protein